MDLAPPGRLATLLAPALIEILESWSSSRSTIELIQLLHSALPTPIGATLGTLGGPYDSAVPLQRVPASGLRAGTPCDSVCLGRGHFRQRS